MIVYLAETQVSISRAQIIVRSTRLDTGIMVLMGFTSSGGEAYFN